MRNAALYLSAATSVLGALFVRHLYFRWQRLKEEEIVAVTNGCKPPRMRETRLPFGIELIWSGIKAAKSKHLVKGICAVFEEMGETWGQGFLNYRTLITADPANIEAILSSQFKDFELGTRRPSFFPLLGEGIFIQDGPAWKHSREMLRPQFSRNRVQDVPQLNAQVDDLLTVIPDGQPVDLQPLFFRFTLDTTTTLLFGHSIGALKSDAGAERASAFNEAFTYAQEMISKRRDLVNSRWLPGFEKFSRACAQVHSFIDAIVAKALEASEMRKPETEDHATDFVFLDALIRETKDPLALRSAALHVLLAGRDSTACLLSWIL
ncbi:hypothetical protein MBLNU459_g4759t2 [Dothideomycetes sp. NU459]